MEKQPLVKSMAAGSNLWQEAADGVDPKLHEQLQKLADYSCGPKVLLDMVKQKRDECRAKQWTCKNLRGQRVYVRDILENMTFWLDKIKSVGDVVSSFDPVHAALPWAGARFLLTAATSDIKQHGAMMESLEVIVSAISRYALIEKMYCHRCESDAECEVKNAIVRVYAAILAFLCKANAYFAQNMAKRVLSSLGQLGQDSEVLTHEVAIRDSDLQKWTPLVDKEVQNNSEIQLESLRTDVATMKAILTELEHPLAYMTSALERIQDGLQKDERMKIMKWLSTELYPSHHKTIASHRMANSGQWMIEKAQYKNWKYTTRCPFLWLNGGPGSGKSILTSLVIDDIIGELQQQENSPPLAYFYCSRDSSEPRRADATEVLLSILKQLACDGADEPIFPAVVEKWQQRLGSGSLDRLDLKECVDIITELSNARGAFIIIDALDECPKKSRQTLLESLDQITQNSTCLVRVFVSSRPNFDIKQHFKKIPRLEILAKSNSGDIEEYVISELRKKIAAKKFLGGNPSEEVVANVQETLIDQADGIFRWVSASLETLCGLSHEVDVEQALGKLPSELNDVYAIIMSQIHEGGPVTKELAKKALSWLLCAQQPLSTDEFIKALSNDPDVPMSGTQIDKEYILDMCCNLVKYDAELDVIRFVHLSVREYLETKQPEYEKSKRNASVALACLRACTNGKKPKRKLHASGVRNKTFWDYATVYWPLHCERAKGLRKDGKLAKALDKFVYQDKKASRDYRGWLDNWGGSWDILELDDTATAEANRELKEQLSDCDSWPPNPVFLACAFGFIEILQDKQKFKEIDIKTMNKRRRDPFNVAISHGQKEIVDHFTSTLHYGAEESDEVPLVTAVSMNREEMVYTLLKENEGLRISQNVIEFAFLNSNFTVVDFLVNHERCDSWDVTNNLLRLACSNKVSGDKILEMLLAKDECWEIENETFESACYNTKYGTCMLRMLLEQQSDYTVTAEAVENAAGNTLLGGEILAILFDRDPDTKITLRMLEYAAYNSSLEPMKFLLDKDPDIQVNCQCLLNAAGNVDIGNRLLALLLTRCDISLVDVRVLLEAIFNKKFGVEMVEMLLEKTTREQLPITTEVLSEAAGSQIGERLLQVLLAACPGMKIHPLVALFGVRNSYSPVEILQLLLEHDPSVQLTVEVCVAAIENAQYALELFEFLQPRCPEILKHDKVLNKIPYNDANGFDMVKLVWVPGMTEMPKVSEEAVECACYNFSHGDKILMHWYSNKLPVIISDKAQVKAMDNILAADLLKTILKINKKIHLTPKAINFAASHYTRGPILIKQMIKHLGKGKLMASDDLLAAAISNPESGAEVIEIIIAQSTFHITPAVVEVMVSWDYYPELWTTVFGITKPASVTADAFEYAMRYGQNLEAKLAIILEKNPLVDITPYAWDLIFGNQKSAESMTSTLACLKKYGKVPKITQRMVKQIIRGANSLKILPIILQHCQETHQTLPITAEIIHAAIGNWDEKRNPILEYLFEILSNESRTVELTDDIYRVIFDLFEVEGLVELFGNNDYAIPTGDMQAVYMQYAIANGRLKDETLDDLFEIDSDQRKAIRGTEEGLETIIQVSFEESILRRTLSEAPRPLPITPRVLKLAIDRRSNIAFWFRTAAAQDPDNFPSLLTEEVIGSCCRDWTAINELQSLALQYKFRIPLSPKALTIASFTGYEVFKFLVRQLVEEGGRDRLLSFLSVECLIELSKSSSSISMIRLLKVHVGEDGLQPFYSEPMLTASAGVGQHWFFNYYYDEIPNAKPKQHYQDICDLYSMAWDQDPVRLRPLLNKGIDPNHPNSETWTPLASAANYGENCMLNLLLRYPNVDVNAKDNQGRTPLMLAANEGNFGAVEALLKHGAERQHRSLREGRTAEEGARWWGHYELSEYIRDFKIEKTVGEAGGVNGSAELTRKGTFPPDQVEHTFLLKKRMTSKW